MATCFAGLAVSVGFLSKTWRAWLSSGIRPTEGTQGTGESCRTVPKGKPSSSVPMRGEEPASSIPMIVKSAETSGATNASHSSLVVASAPHPVPILAWTRNPRRRHQFVFRPLPTLLLLTWSIFTLDQILMVSTAISLLWICPEFNCFARMLPVSGDCPSALFFTVMVFTQALGACTFVLSTMIRFIHVFFILSRPRFLVLRGACGVVVATTLVRVLALVIRVTLFNSPSSALGAWLDLPIVYAVTEATYVLFYGVIGLSCLVSLALGVHYVFHVRRKVHEAGVSSVALTQFSTETTSSSHSPSYHAALAAAPDSSHSAGDSLAVPTDTGQRTQHTSPVLLLPHSRTARASHSLTNLSAVAAVAKRHLPSIKSRRLSHKERIVHHTRMVLVWIASAMATLATFAAIMLIPGVASKLPSLFLNSFMTLFLKCFSAFVTLAIGSMTQLVLSHQEK